MKKKKDSIYAEKQQSVTGFRFNSETAEVFEDMIERSVPGYRTTISMIGLLAERYSLADSFCYDLGCSLGAATLAMRKNIKQPGCSIVAVDNSEPMIEKCRTRIEADTSQVPTKLICADIQDVVIENASIVVLNFILQFIEPKKREALLHKIYSGMVPGGILILSEKVSFDDKQEEALNIKMHHTFKKAHGYSDLEISQKRTALEKVLIPETLQTHQQRLEKAGFSTSTVWFQCFNFMSIAAVK
jgi:tRNA (cmo5U34)-methyltransferase